MSKFLFSVLFCFVVSGSIATSTSTQVIEEEQSVALQIPGYLAVHEEIETLQYFGKTFVIFRGNETEKLTWTQSHIKCVTHGMKLASFEAIHEFQTIAGLLQVAGVANNLGPKENGLAWLAISNLFNSEFTNLYTGKPFSEFYANTFTEDGEMENRNCAYVKLINSGKGSESPEYGVDAANCSTKMHVLCQY